MRVDLEAISVVFGDVKAISGFTASIEPQRLTALVGPSGSGKSTLLAIIAGSLTDFHGSVRWLRNGEQIRMAPSIAWVTQSPHLLPDRSAIDNVMLARLALGEERPAAQATSMAKLEALGLAERSAVPSRLLSGGEQQRLAFARALAMDADLVLADEPTASLDEPNTRHLCSHLQALSRDQTVVVATHDPLVVAACDRVIDVRSALSLPPTSRAYG